MKKRGNSKGGRLFAAGLGLVSLLAGCTPPPHSPGGTAAGPVTYPDLATLPGLPGLPPDAGERAALLNGLEDAHQANTEAGDNLNREIENDFEIPSASGN
jgi:hypothetical protein